MEINDNKELNEHIKSIGKWAAEDKKRIAFVVCGEMMDDGVKTSNSLVGRSDRIARALFGTAMEDKSFKQTIRLVAEMIESPLLATILSIKATESEKPNDESKGRLADSLKELLDALKEKIKND